MQVPEYFKNPTGQEVRKRIQNISKIKIRLALKFQYLTASRISEVTGKYAVTWKQFELANYQEEPGKDLIPAIIFLLRTAKRKGMQRATALPLVTDYEPWAEELMNYFIGVKDKGNKKNPRIFKMSSKTVQNYSKEAFQGMKYWIEGYSKVEGHTRNFLTHALRHVRSDELMMQYGFDGIDIAIYCGWRLSRQMGVPKMAEKYVYGQWVRYFPKLLKPYGTLGRAIPITNINDLKLKRG